jgi:hypothetical protein
LSVCLSFFLFLSVFSQFSFLFHYCCPIDFSFTFLLCCIIGARWRLPFTFVYVSSYMSDWFVLYISYVNLHWCPMSFVFHMYVFCLSLLMLVGVSPSHFVFIIVVKWCFSGTLFWFFMIDLTWCLPFFRHLHTFCFTVGFLKEKAGWSDVVNFTKLHKVLCLCEQKVEYI